jgi:ParB family transcriptional regulator, chromosome partitioning protein
MIQKKTPRQKSVLGRGLHALLADAPFLIEGEAVSLIQEIAIEQIEANPFQPRKDFDLTTLQELRDSIALHGIVQPLTVRKLAPSMYQLIAGERRLKAAKMVGFTHIPAYIRIADDQQMLEMALVENVQRENLNPIEIALSYQRLLTECQIKQDTLGARVGKNRATVNNYLRLLKLPPDIQVALRDHKISMGHARALINVETIDAQLGIFRSIIEEDLSVRNVEELVRNLSHGKPQRVSHKYKVATILESTVKEFSTKLTTCLGTQVKIRVSTKAKGEIKIAFASEEELNRILKVLAGD